MLVAVSLLAISLSLLIYHHPPSTWRASLSSPADPATRGDSKLSEDGPDEPRFLASKQQIDTQELIDAGEDDTHSPQTTPKAGPSTTQNGVAIPTFTLAEHETDDEEEDNLPPPSFPALNSAQRASAQRVIIAPPFKPSIPMAPPPKPSIMAPLKPTGPSLMAPPKIVPSNLRALPNPATTPASSLRVPTTGPLPNRGPVPNRASNGGLPVPKPSNARGKVLLSPGHSPLDWADLQRSGKNLSGVNSLVRVSPTMLKHNNGRKGKPAWSNYQGKVYNITPYLPFHPGGEGEIRRAAGKDGGKLFMEVHPWVNWENMLGECLVGIMVTEEQKQALTMNGSSLEDMD